MDLTINFPKKFNTSQIHFIGLNNIDKDYEKPHFVNRNNPKTEIDIFEKSISEAKTDPNILYRYTGKIFEDAGKYEIARDFFQRNFKNDIMKQNSSAFEFDKLDLERIQDKINEEKTGDLKDES